MTRAELPQLRQFDATIQQWIDMLGDYTLELLHRPPRPGSWSLGQVYIHIIDDTSWFAGQMKEALLSRSDADKTMHPDARAMWVSPPARAGAGWGSGRIASRRYPRPF